ncbi:MAG: bifunctional oligoribonuclease/PAP phosphatase NrnA [Halobacteriaceae archaeon]
MATLPPSRSSAASPRAVRDLSDALSGATRSDPLLVVGAAALALVALALLAYALYRLRRTRGGRFRRLLSDLDEVAVLTHPNPDPDAMASALAVVRLAGDVGTSATLRYPGEIRHQENRAFRTVLDFDCEDVDAADDLSAPVVCVDHGAPRGFTDAETVSPVAVVDHHPDGGEGERFTDVRPGYGACSTILAEYFEELDVDLPDPETEGNAGPLSTDLATGLLYGVLSDTGHLTNGCSSAEFQAARYLYPAVDEDLLDRIANPSVDAEVLDVKSRAIADRDVRAPFAVADVGDVSNVDAIPQAADELVRLEGVSAVVVVGHRDGVCQLSGRSRDDRVHMGETLRAAIEDLPDANAGGHARMGGGRVRLNGADPEPLVDRLFAAMNGER